MNIYEKYLEKVFLNVENLIENKNIKDFILEDQVIKLECIKDNTFFALDHFRSMFRLNDYLWICFLISIFNEISNTKDVNPFDFIMKNFNFKNKFEYYECKQELEISFSLFLDKNQRIDKYILEFIMTNGLSSGESREFKIYFPSEESVVREKECSMLADVCNNSKNVYFFIFSKPGMGKKTAVKRIASIRSKALVIVDIEKCLNSDQDFSQIIISSLRQCKLMNGMICFDKIDVLKDKNRKLEFIFEISKNFCKNSFFLLNNKIEMNFDFDNTIIEHYLKDLNSSQIYKIWKDKLRKIKLSISININYLSNTFRLTPKQIENAIHLMISYKMKNKKIDKEHIFRCIQKTVQANFGKSAIFIKSNNSWEDLIIDEDEKQMIIDICKQRKIRSTVFEDWKLGEKINYGKGLSILFSGPPGTGKTMAASIVANEMDLELYKVDLSNVVSKYIGETEKNLSYLFDEAERSNSILLFDETDSLFSQRTNVKDSKDRGANLEVSYLLQRMENHNGICIMTTNYIENIDKAFFRRISYVFHFSNPNKSQRKEIWKNLLGKDIPLDDIDFDFISNFEISGGSIKNIVVSSCLRAAQHNEKVSMKQIILSIEYELKKQGYTPLKQDFGQYAYLL